MKRSALGSFLSASTRRALPMLLLDQVFALNDPSTQLPFVSKPASTCSFDSLTILGDSYSAGFGALQRLSVCQSGQSPFGPDCTTAPCAKDSGAYGFQFAAQQNISSNFQYLACSGATTDDIVANQIDSSGFGTPAVVALTAGGDNDESFFRIAEDCIFAYAGFSQATCDAAIDRANNTITQTITDSLDKLYSAIQSKINSATKVVNLGYVQFWGHIGGPRCVYPFILASDASKSRMNQLVLDINAKIHNASKTYKFLYADPNEAYDGHRICSNVQNNTGASWIQLLPKTGFDPSGKEYFEESFGHPTMDGQNAYLQALKSVLGC